MSKSISILAGALVWGLLLSSCGDTYKNVNKSPEERAADLVSRLTLEQKVSLMQNSSPAIPEFGIKEYDWWNEALHGVGRAGLATVFPQAIGMAASFDDALLLDVFNAVSDEARAKSAEFGKDGLLKRYQGLTFWTPNVNIFRGPRWGRGQETYGEDPYLTSRMGVSVVCGLQGPADSKYDKLHACAKHYAVHSGPEWNRHVFNAEDIEPRDLWETYLPAFKALVQEAGVKEVMCAYNRYEDEPCCGSNRLLQQILRNEWGYKGIILSDCWAINDFFTPGHHNTEPDAMHATTKAVLTGTDLECGSSYGTLVEAVEAGLITEKQIDNSVIRLMKARFELGEMDDDVEWNKIPYSVVNSEEHQALALKMAQESMVLLQNNGVLPLSKDIKVAVVGPNANDSVMQWGNYNGTPGKTITLLDGIRAYIPEQNIIFAEGCEYAEGCLPVNSLFGQCHSEGTIGFAAKYWNNADMNGEPDVLRHMSTPFRLTTGGATVFAPNVSLENFSSEYEATFHAEEDGDVAFFIQNKGKAWLSIDGKHVATADNPDKCGRIYTLKTKSGQDYQIKINFACVSGEATLVFDMGYEIDTYIGNTVRKVQDADIVVFAGGISPSLEGEEMPVSIPGFKGGDRTAIELPQVQTNLVKALKDAGKRVVFVSFSGSALALTDAAPYCDAILQAWYPGQAGGTAVATTLFGDYNPAGRLPVTFYKSTAQLPDFEDYSMRGRTYRYMTEQPLFPFGYGLSYTTFSYGDAKLSATALDKEEVATLRVPVSNTGGRDGDEVVQIYVCRPGDNAGPQRTLRAFKRVSIPAGQTSEVSFELTEDTFQWFDVSTGTMHAIPGTYCIMYGPSSDPSSLHSVNIEVR